MTYFQSALLSKLNAEIAKEVEVVKRDAPENLSAREEVCFIVEDGSQTRTGGLTNFIQSEAISIIKALFSSF